MKTKHIFNILTFSPPKCKYILTRRLLCQLKSPTTLEIGVIIPLLKGENANGKKLRRDHRAEVLQSAYLKSDLPFPCLHVKQATIRLKRRSMKHTALLQGP